ncbi:hypothetical protein [Candidatus Stoquefichus sp. SB1]|uniref:hypothetical protein n=1 Tax=Candidatus Stoquefichus sp. SB1 TaxID=1658109 RepID=UPI00067F0AF6|nr:hypothetical protein [Candidatus Stoquefichus sp. SB1]
MRKKIRYDRLMIVGLVCILVISIFIYMLTQRKQEHVYSGNIETYIGTYRQNDKVYTFDLKAFIENDQYYISLNDMYNMMIILDEKSKVFINQNKHVLTYQLSQIDYHFDYGHDKIVYNNDCIDLNKKNDHIYIYHKNVYISVYYIEKLLLNNEKKIKFENKNAIIA